MTEDPKQLAAQLAEALNETEEIALQQIEMIVERFSPEFAINLYHEVEEIEANGGMLTRRGDRRRTPGGVYLYLARERAQTGKQRRIFYPNSIDQNRIQREDPNQLPTFEWAGRLEILNEIFYEHGEATTVKLTLIGRPGKIARRRDMVVTTITHTNKKSATLPKGVPTPPSEPTIYTVYIGAKQWNKVEQSLIDHPDDALIIEGLCAYDPEIQGIAVFAQSVMSKLAQQKGKNPNQGGNQQSTPQQNSPAQSAQQPTAKPAGGMSLDEAKRKLSELRRAEGTTRETLDELKALPPEEQVGMARTLQDLQRIKDEIKNLRQQYPELG